MTNVTKKEYWTTILNDPTQIGQITTEDTEFNRRINDVNLVLSNTFINSSDENLISKWETSLYIDGIEGKTITERKADILYTLCEKNYVPVSIIKRFLLNLIGDENRFVVEFIKDENKLVIHTDRIEDNMLVEVNKLLDSVVSQNVVVEQKNCILPAGYKQVEYLQTQASTAIFTNVYPTLETEIRADMLPFTTGNFGVFTGASNYFSISLFSNEKIRFDFGKTWFDGLRPETVAVGKRFNVKANKNAVYINDDVVLTVNPPSPFVSTYDLCLNRMSRTGGNQMVNNFYSYEIYESGELVLDFIPCLDETGAPCMFDMASKTSFYNIGSGDFLYPTESTTYALRRVLPDWGKLTQHGLRRLYHAPANYSGELVDYAMENGFKPIIEPEMPEEGYWTPQWRETDEEIILDWIETEAPSTEDFNLEQPTEI